MEPPTTSTSPTGFLGRLGDQLALSIFVPVMADDYDKETDKMKPRRFGVVVLTKLLDQAFVNQMAELTGMHVNIFAGDRLAFGDLPSYTASLKDVAEGEGDLTKRIPITSKDEIGELSHWFNLFVEKLQIMIQDISKSSQALSRAVDVTREASRDISENSDQMLATTQTVNQSTNGMSSQISSISKVMGRSSDNLDIVASATEEMTATINEIARNAEAARIMSMETGEKIDAASAKVNQLGADAKEIDGFTASINDISEQTNLLALNATIEAARAGEAGKGFAVVAGEIKELARQTATATQDIKNKIDNIMHSSGGTVDEMASILKTFGDMNNVVNDIASAIEEQSATTKEIADNTATVATGISDVNASISQFDSLTTDIATQMETVNQSSAKMSENCTNINSDTREMGSQTGKLDNLINRFVIK